MWTIVIKNDSIDNCIWSNLNCQICLRFHYVEFVTGLLPIFEGCIDIPETVVCSSARPYWSHYCRAQKGEHKLTFKWVGCYLNVSALFMKNMSMIWIFIHSFIPLPCAECDDSLAFWGASSVPLCYVLFPVTLLHQLFIHPLSPHLVIYFLVYLSNLFPNSYIIPFWKFYFLAFSLHAQTNVIYLTVLSLLQ